RSRLRSLLLLLYHVFRLQQRRQQQLPCVRRRSNLFVRKTPASSLARGLPDHRLRTHGHTSQVEHSRKRQSPALLVRARSNLLVPCPPAIAVRFPGPCPATTNANVVARVLANPCARSRVDKVGVHLRPAPEDLVVPVDRAAGVLASVPERCPRARVP